MSEEPLHRAQEAIDRAKEAAEKAPVEPLEDDQDDDTVSGVSDDAGRERPQDTPG